MDFLRDESNPVLVSTCNEECKPADGGKIFGTPLHWAVLAGHRRVVDWLLNLNVEINLWAQNMCQCYGLIRCPYLPQQSLEHNGRFMCVSPLHLAICNSHLDIARDLVSYSSASCWIVAHQFPDRLNPAANRPPPGWHEWPTALHTAAASGQTSIMSFLVSKLGVNPDERDHEQKTAFEIHMQHFTTTEPLAELIRLTVGFESVYTDLGEFLLEHALEVGNFPVATYLLDSGASPIFFKDINRREVLLRHMLFEEEFMISLRKLRGQQADLWEEETKEFLADVIKRGLLDIRESFPVGYRSSRWHETPLTHLASFGGFCVAGVDLLLDLGVPVDSRNGRGFTALETCVYELETHQKCFRAYPASEGWLCWDNSFVTLVKRGASLSVRDKNGRTPLERLMRYTGMKSSAMPGADWIVRLIVEHAPPGDAEHDLQIEKAKAWLLQIDNM
jgi:ankyrin repeat protein